MSKKRIISNESNPGPGRHYRCVSHPERYPAVPGRCWECYLGRQCFIAKFGLEPEIWYQPGGPGYAGPAEGGNIK